MARVLFVAESFHPVLGGGEKHIRDLSAALVRAGMPATVLTRRGRRDWPREEMLDGARVLRVPPAGPGRVGKYAMVAPVMAAMRRERANYDVVMIPGTRILGLPGLIAAHALGKPAVLQAEMTGEMSGEIYVWGTPFQRPAIMRLLRPAIVARNLWLRRAEAFVAISRPIEQEFLSAGLARARVVYIPHAVDVTRFRPAERDEAGALRGRLGLPPDALLMTYTGRLLKGKGLEVFVAALAQIAPSAPQAHAVIVGAGGGQSLSIEEPLKEQVRSAGLAARVTFTGRVENVEEYLRASDVFVFPSLFEGLPHSIVEAAAAGLPMAASRAGGIPDVVEHEGNGILVEPGDVSQLAAALRRLIGEPQTRARMAARARATACERFALAAVARQYRDLFESLVERRPVHPPA